jgi:IS30 family transposase
MELLALKHPHRIDAIVTSLKSQRVALLDVSNALNKQFEALASQYNVSTDTIWKLCYATRYEMDTMKYHEGACELEALFGLKYDEIENAVLKILENTHRCSSMIENFNSRLRPYLDERKFMSQKSLNLIQFYLNHKPFMRSKHERLVNKTPAEALTGKPHKLWLEMLGFTPWYKQAA